MSEETYQMIEGIQCYHPKQCQDYEDYPSEGFDVTDALEEKSFWCRSRNRLLKKLIQQYVKKNNLNDFFELGCGTGFLLRDLVHIPNLKLTGSEMYLKGLQYAKSKLPQVNFVQLDATQATPALYEQFDIVGAFDVIEHIEEDRSVIQNAWNMLRPGGYFFVTVPQHPFLWSRLDEIVEHKRRYTRKELISKLKNNKFIIKRATSFLFVLFPLMCLSRLLDRNKKETHNTKENFEKRVKLPSLVNNLFDKLMRIDESLIHCGLSLPFGGSLFIIAQKPK